MELGKKLIDEAYLYGARMMLVGSGPDPGPEKRAEGLKQLAKSLGELCSYARSKAKDHVLTITLEHFDRDMDKKFLLGPTVETAEFIRELRKEHDNLGVTLDQSHLYQLGEDAEESARLVGDLIVHAHFANCVVKDPSHPLYGDKHTPFSVPGGEGGSGADSALLGGPSEVRVFLSPPAHQAAGGEPGGQCHVGRRIARRDHPGNQGSFPQRLGAGGLGYCSSV